ncbi:MAG: metal-dependent transcriptional regulator [Chloroflexi bacterium]|nr:metal-dependent transcriptional regulator [Chloroflexota bacterium]
MTISAAMERYAAEIYRLQEENEYAPLSEVAEHVHVSLQAASRMIRRLKEAGIVDHEPYKGVQLTSKGENAAARGLRRHRLAERYLVDVMGFGWDEVHELTHDFELGISPAIEARIDEMLGYPTRCPHGEPIPDRDGNIPELNDQPLTEVKQPISAQVTRVRSHDPKKLRYFAELGILPGVSIDLLHRAPFEGPMRLRIGTWREQVVGYQLAEALWVRLDDTPHSD